MTIGRTTVLTPAEARAAARKILGQRALGTPTPAVVPTFRQFLDTRFANWAKVNRRTGEETVQRLRACFPALLSVPLDRISPWQIERWRSRRLKAGRTPATINRDLGALKAALNRAVEWGVVATNPIAKVKPAQIDRRGVVRYLSPAEEQRLRHALSARDAQGRQARESANLWRRARGYAPWPPLGRYADHLTPLVLLALNTGLRRGELFGATWQDVDLSRAMLTIPGRRAKSGETRHVPLNQEAVQVLRDWAAVRTTEYVFPSPASGLPLTDIKSAWLPLVQAAGVSCFRFHDLRHTFASKLVMAGVDLNTVRELLGHADLGMTLRYAHLAPEHKAAAVALLTVPGEP